ncbi:MAG: translation initiation factor IF-2, partial [Erysipelotrichaceae bacterium]
GRGPVATILVQNGTLHSGDALVIGSCFCKVRKMVNDIGKEIQEALPSTPVEIIGLSDVPIAGDNFKVFTNERQARIIAEHRQNDMIELSRRESSARSLDDLSQQIKDGNVAEINVIIKADVQGTAEAVKSSIEKIEVGTVRVNVIRSTAGAISESDIMLADASNAIIYGFNVRPDANIRKKAEESNVTIRLHNIIYKVVEEMEKAMKGLLEPEYEEVILGQATVRQTFKVSKVGTIAGCIVNDGKLVRNCQVRLIRNGIVVYTGKLGSLKRFENDVKEVANGYECGITIENFNDIKESDVIEAFGEVEVSVE